jgi:uncharacterized protein (TIGR02145 family)
MMRKALFNFLIGFLLTAFAFSCDPDDPSFPNNPLNGKTTAVFNPAKKYGTVTDIDGNTYKTIVIGEQTWMAENLRVTRYRNGDSIPNVTDNEKWANLETGAYCNYNNTNSLDTIATYGRLYNFYAVADERNIAPKGWRMPDMVDWLILIEYLGGDTIAGGKLKEAGDLHWEATNRADNSSGFTALPGVQRDQKNGKFDEGDRFFSVWWANNGNEENSAPFLYLFCWSENANRGYNFKVNGYSIRCIKD